MGWIKNLGRMFSSDRTMRRRGEDDAPTDPVNGTRESTDGDGTYVGRGGPDEAGDAGISGAEGRAGGRVSDHDGAGRPE